MKYNTLKFELNRETGMHVLTDVISDHTMFQDYPVDPIPVNEIAEHGVKEYAIKGSREYQFTVCNDFKSMDWYIQNIAIPYEVDISKWKEIMLKVLEADEGVSKNDLKELFG